MGEEWEKRGWEAYISPFGVVTLFLAFFRYGVHECLDDWVIKSYF